MPDPKDDPKSSEWRPYIFARDQWHCRICGGRFLYFGDGTQTHCQRAQRDDAAEHVRVLPRRSLAAKKTPMIFALSLSI
jgi:hypothetical protein